MESRKPSATETKFFIYKFSSPDKDRLMTVINGIPFYQSTGHNSKQPHTWLPHRGVEENGTWIIKPKQFFQLPAPLRQFILDYKIDLEIKKNRLGSVEAMCISASIGGGFWDTDKGKHLHEFLLANYPDLFLHPSIITQFRIINDNNNTPKGLNTSDLINAELQSYGAIIPLNNPNNRLPRLDEKMFFNREEVINHENREKIWLALTMLLTNKTHIDDDIFNAILALAKDSVLLDYALEIFLFEDPQQIQVLVELHRSNQITKTHLEKNNSLAGFNPQQYQLFPHHLYLLRCLHRSKLLTDENVAIIAELNTRKILKQKRIPFAKLLNPELLGWVKILIANDRLSGETLKFLSKTENFAILHPNMFAKKNFPLVKDLRELNLLTDAKFFFRKQIGIKALKGLRKNKLLTKTNITLINYLHKNKILENALPYFDNPHFISAIAKLQSYHLLTSKSIKILATLIENNALAESMSVFDGNSAAVQQFIVTFQQPPKEYVESNSQTLKIPTGIVEDNTKADTTTNREKSSEKSDYKNSIVLFPASNEQEPPQDVEVQKKSLYQKFIKLTCGKV